MNTLRDYHLGARPTCAACGQELDPECDSTRSGFRAWLRRAKAQAAAVH